MTTEEFIKMLQEADPSGKAHIRMAGGVPLFAELKPGYWDGPYSYINDDGNYVTSTQYGKVDIHCLNIWDFVERVHELPWEEVKAKFIFDFTYTNPESKKEKEDRILKVAKEAYDDINEVHEESRQRSLSQMRENVKKGWTWFQNKEVDTGKDSMHTHYTWKVFDENGKNRGSNIHMTEPILESGEWERVDNSKIEGYYEWVYKNKP